MEKVFFYLSNILNILPILCFLIYFKDTKKAKSLWIIFLYSLFAISTFVLYLFKEDNLTIHFYLLIYLIEFISFCLVIFFFLEFKNFKLIILLLAFFLSISFIVYISTTKSDPYDPILIGSKGIFLILFSFLFFYERIQSISPTKFSTDFRFWGVFGILIYIAGSFLFFVFFTSYKNQLIKFAPLIYTFYALKSIFFAYSMISYIKYNDQNKNSVISNIPNLDFE